MRTQTRTGTVDGVAKTKRADRRVGPDHETEERVWTRACNRLGVRKPRGETPRAPLPDRRNR